MCDNLMFGFKCEDHFNCCDCGGSDDDYPCCYYCWSCNACEECLSEDE